MAAKENKNAGKSPRTHSEATTIEKAKARQNLTVDEAKHLQRLETGSKLKREENVQKLS